MKSLKQRLASKKLRRPSAPSLQEYLKKRKQRLQEEETKRKASASTSLKLFTTIITFISMGLGLSFIPLFPQPLPVLIAFLIAFGVFIKPEVAMPAGGLMIGLGMIYHLASMNFIAMLGPPIVRAAVLTVIVYLFVALPMRFRSYEDAIAINIGIMAATLLFFNQTYIFAVPLLLTVAVIFKKEQGGLALAHYALISVPFQIIQFSKIIPTIARTEWWLDPNGVPPLFVSLNGVFKDMQISMDQFRLFDQSKVVSSISTQLTVSEPPASAIYVGKALTQYLDSFPGIILFLALVLCLIFIVSTIALELRRKPLSARSEIIFPAISAAGVTTLFFLLAIAMQQSLAFKAQMTSTQIASGILMTLFFALPLSYVNYAPKKRRLIEERSIKVRAKTQELTAKLEAFENLLNKVKAIPANVSAPEGKMLRLQDKLNDIIAKTDAKLYEPAELDAKLREMTEQMTPAIDNLTPELYKVVEEYQLRVNYEYTTWLKKLKTLGFEIKTPVKADFKKDITLEERIENIQELLENSRALADEVGQNVELIYSIIRTLYDQTLPEHSRTITFARQQLGDKNDPWFATDSLFSALTNWKTLYNRDVSKSVEYLIDSLKTLISLNEYAEKLQPALGENYERIMYCMSRAGNIKRSVENKHFTIANLPFIKDALETTLSISIDLLSMLHDLMVTKETSIENMLPIKEDFWEKNVTLRERTAISIKTIADASQQELNKTMAELPKALSQISECIDTLSLYSEKEELLLNYPVAKTAIEELLKRKKRVSAEELPFERRYAEKYLQIFYTNQKNGEFYFDEANMSLAKKS